MVQPSTKVTPRVYLGVVYKALSAPFDPLTEAKEQALTWHVFFWILVSLICFLWRVIFISAMYQANAVKLLSGTKSCKKGGTHV